MRDTVQPADLSFFSTLAASGSLSAAARELGLTAAAVSKRLTLLEARLGVRLLNRTTRKMTLTGEGEEVLRAADRILADIAALEESMTAARVLRRFAAFADAGQDRVDHGLDEGRVH